MTNNKSRIAVINRNLGQVRDLSYFFCRHSLVLNENLLIFKDRELLCNIIEKNKFRIHKKIHNAISFV